MMQNSLQLRNLGLDLSLVVSNKFNLMLSDWCIADQVATLLNRNNKLTKIHTSYSIMADTCQYFIEVNGQTVIGCIGLLNEPTMDKIVHLSVSLQARNIGVGFKLIATAINASNKNVLYMTIREDNHSSLRLASKLGFKVVAYKPKYNYNVLTLCLFRRKNVTKRTH